MFDSPESASLWFDIFNVVLAVGAAMVAVATWGTIKTAAVKEKFSDERITANEAEAKRAVAESDKANAALEVARGDIAKANAEIAQANERAETARLETERLKQTLSWRILTPELTSKLVAVLSTKKGRVNLRYTDGDPEAITLASQFAAVFAKAEWQVAHAPFKAENGIIFGIYVPDSGGDDARILQSALKAANIAFSPEELPLAPTVRVGVPTFAGAPTMMLGSKPQLP